MISMKMIIKVMSFTFTYLSLTSEATGPGMLHGVTTVALSAVRGL